MTSLFSGNLSALRRRSAELAQIVAEVEADRVEVRRAADGSPILAVGGVPLDNVHAPAVEASRWAADQLAATGLGAAECLIVMGFGAGYHLEALVAGWTKTIVVIEPHLGVLRAALETRDLRHVLDRVQVRTDAPAERVLEGLGRVAVATFAPAIASDRFVFRGVRAQVHGRVGRRQMRLKVLVVSPLHGGTLPITGYVARALAAQGHAVGLLDMSPFQAGFRHIPAFGAHGEARLAVEGRFIDFLADGILRRVDYEEPDLVLALAQAPLTSDTLDRLATAGVPTALWFVEDFRRFPYWRDVGPHYRYVFTIQRDECLDAFAAAGISNAFYLPCAADPAVHVPLDLSPAEAEQFGSAVSFVGAGYRNRRVMFRRLVDLDFKIWGSEWRGAEGLWDGAIQRDGERVSTDDAVRIFNATRINLNLHSSTYTDGIDPQGDFVNPRTFELAACGAFQLVDDRRYLPELFVPGVEVATFASAAALRDGIVHYLAHPEECATMTAAGRRRVLAEHTYEARMGELLERVFGVDYERYLLPRPRRQGAAALVEAAGASTGLGRYIGDTCGDLPDVGLEDLAAEIRRGRGPLSEEEEIVLFLKQYDEMFLTAYRP